MHQSLKNSIGMKMLSAIIPSLLLSSAFILGTGAANAAGLQTTTKPKPLVQTRPVQQRPQTQVTRPATTATRPAQAGTMNQGGAANRGTVNTRPQPIQTPNVRPQQPASGSRITPPAAHPSAATSRPFEPKSEPRAESKPEPKSEPRSQPSSSLPNNRLPHSTSTSARPAEPAKSRIETTPAHSAINEPKETPKQPMANKPVRPVIHVTEKDSKGHVTGFKTESGATARVNPKTGKVTSFRKVGTDGSVTNVHTSPSGVRNVETVRKDTYGHPVRIVSHGGTGYEERDLLRRPGYKQRTTFDGRHSTVTVYHTTSYGRYGSYPVYVPDHYYHPAFYAYIGTPFPAPVAYAWGPNPAYAAYGPYFRPAPSYGSPAAFIADFSIGANLNAAAGAQQPGGMGAPGGMGGPGGSGAMGGPGGAAGPGGSAGPAGSDGSDGQGGQGGSFPAPGDSTNGPDANGDPNAGTQPEPATGDPTPIPADVRDAYIQQVQGQIKQAQAEASGQQQPSTVPGALDPNYKTFLSYSDVQADNSGQQCALTSGDFVRREEDTPDASSTVAVTVVTIAKPTASHCEANARVRLPVETLQDWYNSYLESQQQGFAAMAAAQGKNGFPPAPDVATNANPFGQGTPDDPHALAGALQQQQSDASAIQAEVQPGGGQ